MQKDILVKVAEKANFTQKDTKLLLETFIDVLSQECSALKPKERLTITNFITFKAVTRSAKTIVNPKTGVVCEIKEAKRIRIHPTKTFQYRITKDVCDDEEDFEGDD